MSALRRRRQEQQGETAEPCERASCSVARPTRDCPGLGDHLLRSYCAHILRLRNNAVGLPLTIKRLLGRIHDATTSRWNAKDVQSRIEELNPLLRGWAGYFSQGPVSRSYRLINDYTARRLRIWLMRKRGKRGTGYRQYSDQFLYDTWGLIRLVPPRANLSNAKV